MEMSLIQSVSPLGYFSTNRDGVHAHFSADPIVPHDVHRVRLARQDVIRDVLKAEKLTRPLRAKIECLLYRALAPEQWRLLTDHGVDRAVTTYARAIRELAHCGSVELIADSLSHTERTM